MHSTNKTSIKNYISNSDLFSKELEDEMGLSNHIGTTQPTGYVDFYINNKQTVRCVMQKRVGTP